MRQSIILRFIFFFLIVTLAGCMVGPNYHRPQFKLVSAHYHHKPVDATALTPPTRWWTKLHDPALNQLIQVGLSDNISLEMAMARINQAKARYQFSKASFLPTGTFNPSYSTNQLSLQGVNSNNPFTFKTYQQNNLELDPSWQLDLFGELQRRKQSAFANLNRFTLDRVATEVSLAADIAKTYTQYKTLVNRISINQNITQSLLRAYQLNTSRFNAGIVSGVDVTEAKALLTETRALLPDLEFQKAELLYQLDVLIGQQPGYSEVFLQKKKSYPVTPNIPNVGIPSDLLRLRPDILSAEQKLMATTSDIGVAKAALFPKLTLTGSIGLNAFQQNNLFASNALFLTAGPSLSWRILDVWKIDADINEAKGIEQEALANYKSVILNALSEVSTGIVRYEKRREEVQKYTLNLKAQKRNLDLVKEQYRLGLIPFLNVNAAERAHYKASENLSIAKQNFLISYILLNQYLGGGAIDPLHI